MFGNIIPNYKKGKGVLMSFYGGSQNRKLDALYAVSEAAAVIG